MRPDRFIALEKSFEKEANPETALKMAAYMKNHFPFYGIPAPSRRQLYKAILKEDKQKKAIDWQLLEQAWSSPKRELHYFVCDYLRAMQKWLSFQDVPTILGFANSNQWWDTIDHFDHILGSIDDPRMEAFMLELSVSQNFWLRRLAIDHQLGKKAKTNTDLLESIIVNNLGSTEFFINKAIGWALRDYSKINPDWVKSFIDTYRDKLAPLSIREASKYL